MEEVIAIAKALSDENRVRALMVLGEKEVCVCQLIELLQLAPSTVSKHMSILKQAKLVDGRKRGRWMYYRLPEKPVSMTVERALAWVRASASGNHRILLDAEQMSAILEMDREQVCERQSLQRKQIVFKRRLPSGI
ncbi:MAG: metalloregulator ArsR/SmtB family transcription factor [Desulfocapsaceae bacterium]|nr:metalloregulator ArsR/SmtB family transcription factor [Desulfocapsaceae bacterium]